MKPNPKSNKARWKKCYEALLEEQKLCIEAIKHPIINTDSLKKWWEARIFQCGVSLQIIARHGKLNVKKEKR